MALDKDIELALVTGASGFIGSHLCNSLAASGQRVRAAVRVGTDTSELKSRLGNAIDRVELVEIDFSDKRSLLQACSQVRTVIHAAGIAHAGTTDSDLLTKVNVEATRSLAKASQEAGTFQFVYISSTLAQVHDIATASTASADNYGLSKKMGEEALLEFAHENFKVSILRPANVYGPGMKGNIASMIRRIHSGSLPSLPLLNNSLSLVSVADLCQAALLAAQSSSASTEIYPVSDGVSYTPNTIEDAIYGALGRKKPGWRTPRMIFYAASLGAEIANDLGVWKNDIGLRTYRNLTGQGVSQAVTCEKITTELGYQPSQTFYDALPSIIEHMKLKSTS